MFSRPGASRLAREGLLSSPLAGAGLRRRVAGGASAHLLPFLAMNKAVEPVKINPENIRSILATDCGSTTTKAILIEKQGDSYRLICRGEAPTTVEAPFEDVTRGVLNAIREVEELCGRPILDGEHIITPRAGDRGVDLYVSTSSAGGGLQMMVTGVVKQMTGESAQRAALGAGAIVMDVIASNDGRLPHEKIRRIRHLRPDMILLSGGVDGGTTSHVAEMAELLAAAEPKARLGAGYELPVIRSEEHTSEL